MIDYIVAEDTLKEQIGLKLDERCHDINQKYPFPKMNRTLLRLIYKKHKIKQKVIKYKKVVKPDL